MKVITSTEVKNKLGEALSFGINDSLLIQKNGKEAYIVFSAETGKRLVLSSFSQGTTSRGDAMKLLGFEWYGQLLDAMSEAELKLFSLSKEELDEMSSGAVDVLKESV
jgi:hypothetical protein